MSAIEFENRETLQEPIRELWCEGCGYGVVIRSRPPECPMCRGTSWHERPPMAHYN
jgi:rubrerythrin